MSRLYFFWFRTFRSFAIFRRVDCDNQIPFADGKRKFNRLGESRAVATIDFQAIDHHFNIVAHLPIETLFFAEARDPTIDTCSRKALLEKIGE